MKQSESMPAVKTAPAATADREQSLPRLVDLGATKCIPCKMMAPILEDLKKTYAGKMDVQFIDVWENPDAGGKYGIKVIPTQIFYDATGKELFRHEGFFGKEDILAKWRELGIELQVSAISDPNVNTSR
ncbi:MAG: thioredoxin family protein [Verrucomicrobia bacterium]|nr:thioredoxin family protein [Verrucomicrobiota bacterium]MBU4247455.1 thioredoxin family protein [Verrucomicrobiota bacterium]MBU4292286.1 thioredoxin family protein [Verrucomicrobiota bacterium]MBU4429833.1 thioredoxin family protein [Verrucomicrobiota bacterium]MBU4497054.1 thioredoxin family protein [Verrucomicrobiota bacterium]